MGIAVPQEGFFTDKAKAAVLRKSFASHKVKLSKKGMYKMGEQKKFLTFSYDDGISQDKRLVEIFNKYGMKCTFNLNSGIMSNDSCWDFKGVHVTRMTREEIGDLYKGHEIACHFKTHPFPFDLSDAELDEEIGGDIKALSDMFGCEIVGAAYPYGQYDDRVVEALKKHGIKYARTTRTTEGFAHQTELLRYMATCHHNNDRLFELGEIFKAIKPEEPAVFYVWGHSYEFDGDNNWDRIEKFCEMMAGCDDICCCTNREAFGV